MPERATSALGRAELAGELDTLVRPGEPLADLLLRFGEPQAVALDGTALAYRWERVWAYYVAIVPVGGGPAPAPALLPVAGALDTEQALVVDVAQGRVVAARVVATGSRFGQAFGGDVVRAWGTVALFPADRFRGEPVELAARGTWQRPAGERREVVVVLTPTAVHLKAPGAFGPAPADVVLPFAALREARLEDPMLLPPAIHLALEPGVVHLLEIAGDDGASAAVRTQAAWRWIAAGLRSARSAPAPSGAPAPRSR